MTKHRNSSIMEPVDEMTSMTLTSQAIEDAMKSYNHTSEQPNHYNHHHHQDQNQQQQQQQLQYKNNLPPQIRPTSTTTISHHCGVVNATSNANNATVDQNGRATIIPTIPSNVVSSNNSTTSTTTAILPTNNLNIPDFDDDFYEFNNDINNMTLNTNNHRLQNQQNNIPQYQQQQQSYDNSHHQSQQRQQQPKQRHHSQQQHQQHHHNHHNQQQQQQHHQHQESYQNASSSRSQINNSGYCGPSSLDLLQHTTDELKSINFHYEKSFLLIDSNEELLVPSADLFCKRLGCQPNTKLKVISIFGNTGDGKSHTMNHTLFGGEEIFQTSTTQTSCTLGAWAAHEPKLGLLCLDTEGLLGATPNENLRMRMLLKVLAISDIVIYRTRSERLHKDLYTFLGTASKAYHEHFSTALESFGLPESSRAMGPAVLIFHETRNTEPFEATIDKQPEDILREYFDSMKIKLEAFSSMQYIGIQTTNAPTNYFKIHEALTKEIKNSKVRSSRTPNFIYQAIDALNRKYSGKISERTINPFPEQYFTCNELCESCEERCELSMGHVMEGKKHSTTKQCRYQHQFENKVFLCKHCYQNGREMIVKISTQNAGDTPWYALAKYAWSGAVIECSNCGEIYRARKYWYGNTNPEDSAVRTQTVHVWKDKDNYQEASSFSAQRVVDSVNNISQTIINVSAQPTKLITGWVADKIAPSYWIPNSEIIVCHSCKLNFERTELRKHHCRSCGEGFCNSCTLNRRSVPARGWHDDVRVCNHCNEYLKKNPHSAPDDINVVSTINQITTTVASSSTISPTKTTTTTTPPPPTTTTPTTTTTILPIIQTNNEQLNNSTSSTGMNISSTSSLSLDPLSISEEQKDVFVRKCGEVFVNTLSSVSAVLVDYPKDLIKDSVRPSFWVPDSEASNCAVCKLPFGTAEELAFAAATSSANRGNIMNGSPMRTSGNIGGGNNNNNNNNHNNNSTTNSNKPSTLINHTLLLRNRSKHHCRACGQVVCDLCSLGRRPVPERNETVDVRVCDPCNRKPKCE